MDSSGSPSSSTIVYDNCVLTAGNQTVLTDGTVVTTFSSSGSPIPTSLTVGTTFGSASEPYLSEIQAPAQDRFRTLLSGTLNLQTQISNGMPSSASGTGRLQGAAINLARQDTPRADFELGNASTSYSFNLTFNGQGQTATIAFAGPFRASSPCGSGSGTISTPTPLTVNANGDYVSGQISIASGGANATYTYNGNGSVTVSTSGGSATYTQQELQDLCPLFR